MNNNRYLILLAILVLHMGITASILIGDINSEFSGHKQKTLDHTEITHHPVPLTGSQSFEEEKFTVLIREILREELKNLSREFIESSRTDNRDLEAPRYNSTSLPPGVDTSKNAQGYASARQIIEQAIVNGAWTTRDFNQIRQFVGVLTAQQRTELTRRLLFAVNRQELQLDGAARFP